MKTFQGTLLQNVPLSWAIGLGGGVIAPEVTLSHTCGATFGSTAATTTDVNANASVCWTLGATPGTNTVVATPAPGGDAPVGVFFNGTFTFTATAKQITPTAGATGGTFPYDGLAHPGSGTCSNSLTPALSYSGDGSVPTNAGAYTLTVTCGAGNPLYVTVTTTATIQITAATTTTAISCPASAVFTGSPLTPCTATVTGPGSTRPWRRRTARTSTSERRRPTRPIQPRGNYQASSASTTFQVTPASTTTVVSCPASVVFTGAPRTPCTATTTGPGLNAPVTPTYGANVNVGTATVSASYPASGNYQASSGSATFLVTPASTTTAVTCPMSVVFTGSAQTPCSASVSGPGLNAPLTPAYIVERERRNGHGDRDLRRRRKLRRQQWLGDVPDHRCDDECVDLVSGVVDVHGFSRYPLLGRRDRTGLSQSVTPTYVNNVVGPATATVNFTAGGNYLASTASTTFRTLYVQSGCFASPVRSVMPPTSTSVSKSSTVKVNCALLTANATGVTNATGSLVVQDKGTNGLGAPITVLSVANAFSASPGGSYSYSLNTSSAAFVSRHYYFLTATWSDGSTTTGWLYIKSSHDDD